MPFEAASQPDAKAQNIYRLGGNSCLSGDYMGSWRFPEPLEVGQEIVFEDMIHYTTVRETLRTYTYEDYRDRMD